MISDSLAMAKQTQLVIDSNKAGDEVTFTILALARRLGEHRLQTGAADLALCV